jgi:predicted nucleic acid-binding Zn ribbon protein
MTSTTPSPCPSCGVTGAGKFCVNCGAPRAGAPCPSCGAPLSPSARFCSGCGHVVGAPARARSRDRTPWLVAGAALVGLLAVLLVMLSRESPKPAVAEEVGAPAEAPPDISNMSPQERFNRLYNRVMQAAQSGDEATVTRFTPMALMAYAQLDTIDADARYHAALLKVHTGDVDASRALADTILTRDPGHLFGYVIQGTVARFQKDEKALGQAYSGFLKHYDAEMKAGRPEYQEHRRSLDDFRKAALEAGGGRTSGS